MPDPQPMILMDPEQRHEGPYWTTSEMRQPIWSVNDVAKMFGHGPRWVKERLSDGSNVLPDGEAVEPARTQGNHRAFALYDVERIAHAFAYNHVIQARHLEMVITLVKTYARVWGHIT